MGEEADIDPKDFEAGKRRYGRRALVNASDVALYVRKAFGVELRPATIRQWAARGRIGTHGRGRERYDLREVVGYVKRQRAVPEKRGNDGEADDGDVG